MHTLVLLKVSHILYIFSLGLQSLNLYYVTLRIQTAQPSVLYKKKSIPHSFESPYAVAY